MLQYISMETVKLSSLVPGGQAIGTLESGQKAFVWGGLPGEVVEFRVTKKKRSYLEGVVARVLEPSPHRVQPRDDCYLSTSPWQVMGYSYELEQKKLLLKEAFKQEGITTASASQSGGASLVTDSYDFFYRNKMEYSLWWDNGTDKISLAFHQRGSHRKVPITGSSIERPEVLAEAQRIVYDMNARGDEARRYQSLTVRCNQAGDVSSALFENGKAHPKMQPLSDTLLGRKFSYSPNGFFQINLPVYEMALQEIKKHVNTKKVVDMYAGVGTIGLTVAANHDLSLIETNRDAFAELKNNATFAKSKGQVHPILSKSEDALDFITGDATIILDPPRAGLDKRVVDRLLVTAPPTVIYLSCNPTTQARDLAPLLGRYRFKLLQPYNFFPRTPHIENLVVLERL